MPKWEELLRSLSLNINAPTQQDVSKLELWYLQNISQQPPYKSSTTIEKKLTLLKQEIVTFLNTVADISATKASEKFDHLDGMNALQYASKKGYDVYLKGILEKDNRAINLATSTQLTPLHLAALYGHHFTAQILLEYGAATTFKTRLKQSPAHLALSMPSTVNAINKLDIMERKEVIFCEILKNNPRIIAATDDSDNTLAHIAADNGFTSILEDMRVHHPSVLRLKNSTSHSPLHRAILSNQDACTHVLIQDESLLSISDKVGRLPIHYAALSGKNSILENLAKEPYLNAQDHQLKTPLMLAASQGHIDNVKFLIQKGADVSLQDQYGKDVLYYAVMSLNTELVKWLISHVDRIDINQQDKYGRTAIMNLLHETKPEDIESHIINELVDDFLKAGIKLELADKYGNSLQDYIDSRAIVSFKN